MDFGANKMKLLWLIFFFINFTTNLFFVHIKMNYYFFDSQEFFAKSKGRYHNCEGKEKAAEHYKILYWKFKKKMQEINIETC